MRRALPQWHFEEHIPWPEKEARVHRCEGLLGWSNYSDRKEGKEGLGSSYRACNALDFNQLPSPWALPKGSSCGTSITSSALLSVLKARYTERGSALHRYNGDPVSGWRDRTAASYVRGKKTETIQIIPRFPVK